MESIKRIKTETYGQDDISGAFRIANQQSYDEGKRHGQVEGIQREVSRIKEFLDYLDVLEKRYREDQTLNKIREYLKGELNKIKIKE